MKTLRLLIYTLVITLTTSCDNKEEKHPFFQLVGENASSAEVENFVSDLQPLSDSSIYDNEYYLNFNEKGISLLFDKENTLKTIFVYSEGADGFNQYQKALPYDIRFTDDMETLREKLGNNEDGSFALPKDDYIKTSWFSKGIGASMYKEANGRIFIKVLSFSQLKKEN